MMGAGLVVVIYVVVSAIVVMTLSLPSMDANQGHVLSEAGAAAMGYVADITTPTGAHHQSTAPPMPGGPSQTSDVELVVANNLGCHHAA